MKRREPFAVNWRLGRICRKEAAPSGPQGAAICDRRRARKHRKAKFTPRFVTPTAEKIDQRKGDANRRQAAYRPHERLRPARTLARHVRRHDPRTLCAPGSCVAHRVPITRRTDHKDLAASEQRKQQSDPNPDYAAGTGSMPDSSSISVPAKTMAQINRVQEQDAYSEGNFVRALGRPRSCNPYLPMTSEAILWDDGWRLIDTLGDSLPRASPSSPVTTVSQKRPHAKEAASAQPFLLYLALCVALGGFFLLMFFSTMRLDQ
jgi:hypothetical protein